METLLAHQGGWDEILLIAGPIVAIIGLLRLAKKRVSQPLPPDTPADTPASADTSAGGATSPTDATNG